MKTIIDSAELKKLLGDNTSGSKELLFKLNSLLRKSFKAEPEKKRLILFLKKSFPSFESIQNYLNSLSGLIDADAQTLNKFFGSYVQNQSEVFTDIFKSALPYLKDKSVIATISNSGTVAEILIRLSCKKRNLKILICEARPKSEGRLMAEKLASAGIKVELFADAAMDTVIKNCEAVLCGADKILAAGDVINKTGSMAIAVLCRFYKKPFYIAADKTKFSSENNFSEEEKSAGELYKSRNSLITVRNKYFERIDKKLVTRVFTD